MNDSKKSNVVRGFIASQKNARTTHCAHQEHLKKRKLKDSLYWF
jgi:hypothetical protein